jgi:hypothetical protein
MHRVFNFAVLGAPVQITVPVGHVYEIVPIGAGAGTAPDCAYINVDSKLMWFSPNYFGHSPYQQFDTGHAFGKWNDATGNGAQLISVIADEGEVIEFGSFALTGRMEVDIIVHKREEGMNSFTDGGTNGSRKVQLSYAIKTATILAGATTEVQIDTPVNPAGSPVFPYLSVVPPQKRYKFLGMVTENSFTVGTNLTWNAIRVIHEGKSIVGMAGDLLNPGFLFSRYSTPAVWFIMPDDWYFDPYESVQIYARVTSTDAGPQTATIGLTIIMIEENLQPKQSQVGGA